MTMQPFESNHRAVSGKRSRRYPALPIERCIQLAAQLFKAEGRNAAPVSAVAQHWGYSSHTSGSGSATYAAVRAYGLLEEDGRGDGRKARLTDLAIEILKSPEPGTAITRAAFTPLVHAEMWAHFGLSLPSERSLHWTLFKELGFTDKGATDFAKQYRETLEFVTTHGHIEQLQGSSEQDEGDDLDPLVDSRRAEPAFPSPSSAAIEAVAQRPASSTNLTRIPIHLGDGHQITIEGSFPVSADGWRVFEAVLAAMQPGLVEASKPRVEPNTIESVERDLEDLI